MSTRICSKCTKEKPLTSDYFAPNKKSLQGLTRQCRDCRGTRSAEWGRNSRRSDKLQQALFAQQIKKYGKTT